MSAYLDLSIRFLAAFCEALDALIRLPIAPLVVTQHGQDRWRTPLLRLAIYFQGVAIRRLLGIDREDGDE